MFTNIPILRAIYTFSSTKIKPHKKPQIPFKRWQIVTGDTIKVRTGTDKGKVGKVIKVHRKLNAVVVDGVNMRLKMISN